MNFQCFCMTALVLALSTAGTASDEPRYGSWGVAIEHLDPSVHPGDDFFTHVNAGWLAQASMPAGFSRLGSFVELRLEAEDNIEAIINDALAAGGTEAPKMQQIGSFYRSYVDSEHIESLGLEPIQATLDKLLALDSHEAVARWMGRPGTRSLAAVFVTLDAGNPERHVTHIAQSGLGLPDRDYYLRSEPPFPDHLKAYQDYIAATFQRGDIDRAQERARGIIGLETRLAEVHWSRVQRRDRQANYFLTGPETLINDAGQFPWPEFLAERGLGEIEELVLGTRSAVKASAAIFADTPAEVWADYLAFHWINAHAPYLPEAFAGAHFEFFDQRLNGVAERRERSQRAIAETSSRLGELIGQIYVQRHFPPAYRAQMETLVEYLRRAFEERLAALDWMDEETRAEAQAKLAAFTPKIGYPDRWRDFSEVEIHADDLIGNLHRLRDFAWADSLARLDEPVREWEWGMSPQTVNAYYASTRNEIVFPAAILQPPFFDPQADPAVNFGAIGGVIGHEMGHGFDDQGSRSDARGQLRNWWTDASREQFEVRTAALVAQYEQFEPLPGLHINGRLSLGENIGDLGGLSIAHHAYQLYLADHHQGKAPVLDGMTGDQRFFLAWAQVWRNLQTEESLRAQLINGPHSPAPFRVNGVVRNMDAWYQAFNIGPEHALWLPPEERVSIW